MEHAALRSNSTAYGRCTTLRSSKAKRHCSGYGYTRRRSCCFACSQSAPQAAAHAWLSKRTQCQPSCPAQDLFACLLSPARNKLISTHNCCCFVCGSQSIPSRVQSALGAISWSVKGCQGYTEAGGGLFGRMR